MESRDHLAAFIQAVAMDDLESAKASHAKYVELKAEEMINEDHDEQTN